MIAVIVPPAKSCAVLTWFPPHQNAKPFIRRRLSERPRDRPEKRIAMPNRINAKGHAIDQKLTVT